ncbi:hypothetical protein LZ30DRAFT_592069, partial [Colletotrichum cereale]
LANVHRQCYCKLNNVSDKCLTIKACDIYRTSKRIFEPNPAVVNVTMLWEVCTTFGPDETGRQWYVTGLGGNEFEQSCWEAQSSGACPDSEGGDVKSIC